MNSLNFWLCGKIISALYLKDSFSSLEFLIDRFFIWYFKYIIPFFPDLKMFLWEIYWYYYVVPLYVTFPSVSFSTFKILLFEILIITWKRSCY